MSRSWPPAGVLFAITWVFVDGPPLEPVPIIGSVLVGLVVGLPLAYLFRRLYAETVSLSRFPGVVPYAILYLLTFIRQAVISSLDVTYRVLAPTEPPIDPEVILIPLRVQTDLGVTTIAHSITMTPGSLTLDYDVEQNALYVHVIDGSAPEDIVDPIRSWEDYALTIFDEELSAGDPAPSFAVYPPDRTHPVLEGAVTETQETISPQDQTATGGEDDDR